ncbi:hypothetical protein [Streptomyces sp. NRRL F-2890]|uniref:hypothetical protein n=1 Tax=Streptomyces sp. NRRL F-2890 TaxID=1463845 RepID=UPI0004C7DD3F|nr:hypothetical protein [Streptomyces sp. NRRL F-2890]
MIVYLIIAAEIAFWVVLAAGLAVRYGLRRPRAGGALLLCVPLIDVLLLTATVLDLRGGAEPAMSHALAVLYLGFTVGYGHYLIHWADGWAAHRWGGAPRPAKPPRYGWARARHEWRLWRMTLVGMGLSLVVAQLMLWLIDRPAAAEPLRGAQWAAVRILGIHGIIALSYTIWRKNPPVSAAPAAERRETPVG